MILAGRSSRPADHSFSSKRRIIQERNWALAGGRPESESQFGSESESESEPESEFAFESGSESEDEGTRDRRRDFELAYRRSVAQRPQMMMNESDDESDLDLI